MQIIPKLENTGNDEDIPALHRNKSWFVSWPDLYHCYMPHVMLAYIKRPLIKNEKYRLFLQNGWQSLGTKWLRKGLRGFAVQRNKRSQGSREAEPANTVLDVHMGGDYQIETKEIYYWGILKLARLLLG